MNPFLAVIGDLIASKQMRDREAVQEKIRQAFRKINEQYASLIVSKFTLTLGDEFQAVLNVDGGVWECLDLLVVLTQMPFRIGLGYGEISTRIDPEQSLGADGEAYWYAREAIREVHAQNWNGKCNVLFRGKRPDRDALLNTLIMAGETMKSSWTSIQKETFTTLLELGIYRSEFNQQEVAIHMGISESALSKRLTAGNIKAYLHIRESLAMQLEKYND